MMKDKGETLSLDEVLNLRDYIEDLRKTIKFNIVLDIPPAFQFLSRIKENSDVCSIKTIIGILPDGNVSICGIGSKFKELIMGSIYNSSIMDIWDNNNFWIDFTIFLADKHISSI